MNAITLYRISHFFYRMKIPLIPSMIKVLIFLIFNSIVPYQCKIGKYTKLSYGGIGVVIHKRATIGDNVMIGPQVTIGGRSNRKEVPTIGNNVFIATGSKIIGDVKIEDNVVIGANSVVITSVPKNSIVAGIPARVIKSNVNIREYCNLPREDV